MGVSAPIFEHCLVPNSDFCERGSQNQTSFNHSPSRTQQSQTLERDHNFLSDTQPFLYYQCSLSSHAKAKAPILAMLAKKLAFGP
jgi:hypothetical protein